MEKEFKELKKFLSENNVQYEVFSHAPVITSEEATSIIGVPVNQGAKAIVVKCDNKYLALTVLPGDKKINFEKLASNIGATRIILASHAEVLQRTGCEIGSVHPFGSLFELDVYCDSNLTKNELIYFNPGVHTKTIKMKTEDYVNITKPIICEFAE